MRLLLLALLAVGASACTIRSVDTENHAPVSYGDDTVVPDPPSADHPNKAAPTIAQDGVLPEVVYLFMRDKYRQGWMCTATLISRDTIVTAAHCLDTTEFVAYEIVAPNVLGKPTIAAMNPRVWGGPFTDVANPDLGFLTLSRPVDLPAYAELTDVTARVDAGENVQAAAVVRTAEEAEAPLHVVDGLSVSSTVDLGYAHGFGTPMFSEGGDSGAGLFLFENGKITHKLIGIARQPEPAHVTSRESIFSARRTNRTPTDRRRRA